MQEAVRYEGIVDNLLLELDRVTGYVKAELPGQAGLFDEEKIMPAKKKRPLISSKDMARLIAAARKSHLATEAPVQVQPLMKEVLAGRKITNQMRQNVSRKLDELWIPRIRKLDAKKPEFQRVNVRVKAAALAKADPAFENIPGVLGGLNGEIIDTRFDPEAEKELDEFLADEAEKGNRRALRLLKTLVARG